MSKLISIFRDFSLKRKLIIIYVSFITITILTIGLLTYNISIKKLEESKRNQLLQNLKQTNKLIDFNLETYLRKCEMIFSNTIIQDSIGKDYTLEETRDIYNAYQNLIYKTIEPVTQDMLYPNLTLKASQRGTGTDMIKVEIYSNNSSLPKDGKLIKDYSEVNDEKWVKEMNINSTKPYWRSLFKEGITSYVSINRVLRDFGNLQELGVLSIKIPKLRLEYLMAQDNTKSNVHIYLLDSIGNLVTQKTDTSNLLKSNDIQSVFGSIKNNEEEGITYYNAYGNMYICAYTTSEISGWKLIVTYPYNEILNELSPIKYAVIIVLMAGIIISILITFVIAYITTRRLERIKNKMELIKTDRYLKLEEIRGNDEIGQLDRSFNEMIQMINVLVEKEKELQGHKSSLQVELLQSQINPHILYNTLAAIKWRAKKEGISDISIVTDKMIRFFRYFLNKGIVMSSLANELDMISQYIDILKFTYEMSFEVIINLDQKVYEYDSLNLILQPIVENAIVHGIRPLDRQGILEIEGRVKEDKIYFIVRDNGVGIEKGAVDKLNDEKNINNIGGYGIKNVKRRIMLYFGEGYGLNINSTQGKGTEVKVVLPVLPSKENEQNFMPVI